VKTIPRQLFLAPVVLAALAGCAASPSAPSIPPPTVVVASPQILGPHAEGTPRELRQTAERALAAQKFREAADALETLLASHDPSVEAERAVLLYDLATAYEGLEDLVKARETYRQISSTYPASVQARGALAREELLDVYLEDWSRLGAVAAALLARTDVDDVDRLTGLGARGLAEIESGDASQSVRATKDVQDGLDLVDSLHYGAAGRLPAPAAQLYFALGETRKARSEAIVLDEVPDFLARINLRCELLLSAQSAYADAIRSVDPHWAAMSGERVGEMYRSLHHDLMLIVSRKAKNESDRQLFYAMMHVRYRVLLEKGIAMMQRTLDFAAKTWPDAATGGTPEGASAWTKRAEAAKREMQQSLEEEKAEIAKYPFTEEEITKALAILEAKTKATQAKEAAKEAARTR
jgi:hypothetical protein